MSDRNERRASAKGLPKVVRESRGWQRFSRNYKLHGEAANRWYRMDAEGDLPAAYFDVFSLVQFVQANLTPQRIRYDWERTRILIETGAIDREHLLEHTIIKSPDPVVLCREAAGIGRDQIVDGAHRYVAWGLAAKDAGKLEFSIPAYIVEPRQWRQFVILPAMAKVLGLHEG